MKSSRKKLHLKEPNSEKSTEDTFSFTELVPRFSESQIVAILEQHEKGQKVVDICRENGISQPTFYQWQRKYVG